MPHKKKSKVKATFEEIVRVEIKGELQPFFSWCLENNCYSTYGGMTGMGKHIGYYTKKNAAKIKRYLTPKLSNYK